MTSVAFILGVPAPVLASGARANARRWIGISVFSGMLVATCLAALLIPSFLVVIQCVGEHRASRCECRRMIAT